MRRYDIHALVHLPHWETEGLTPFFISVTLRTFASSLVGIYIPLYIYRLSGGSLIMSTFRSALFVVIFYHALLRFTEILANFPVAGLLLKIGFKTSMLIGNLLLLVKIIFLTLAPSSLLFIIPAAILGGLVIPFYWIPYHFIFAETGKVKKFGVEISSLGVLKRLVAVIAPLIGGLIISSFGFERLYFIVFTIIIISVIPIFYISLHDGFELKSFQELLKEYLSRKFFPNLISFAGIGAESQIQQVFWPLFVFMLLGSYEVLGILTSVTLLLSLLILYFVGYWVDRRDKGKTLKFGSYSNSFVWLLRLTATTIPRVFTADLLYKTLRTFLWVPFDVLVYTKARKDRTLQFLVLREWAVNGGRLLALIIMGILVALGVNWLMAFVLAAIFSLLTVFMGRGEGRVEG